MGSDAVEADWERQSVWPQEAGHAKKSVNRSFILLHGPIVVAAVRGALSAQLDSDTPRTRPLPSVTGPHSYLTERVDRQIDGVVRPAAVWARGRLLRTYRVKLLFCLAVAVPAVLGASGLTAATVWGGVVTTVAAAVAAHLASTRCELLHLERSRVDGELGRPPAYASDPHADLLDLVARCERVISTQNSTWVATWTADDAPRETAAP
jgi:hypothetical protein